MPNINYASGDYEILDFEPRSGDVNGVQVQIRIKFKGTPPEKILLIVKDQPIKCDRKDSPDGWVTFDINRKSYGKIRVVAGEGDDERLTQLAVFE